MLRILAMLMKVKVEKREITKNYYSNFVRKTEEDLKDLNKMIEREKEEAEEVKLMINANFFLSHVSFAKINLISTCYKSNLFILNI